jgi:hypothetical protein
MDLLPDIPDLVQIVASVLFTGAAMYWRTRGAMAQRVADAEAERDKALCAAKGTQLELASFAGRLLEIERQQEAANRRAMMETGVVTDDQIVASGCIIRLRQDVDARLQ